MTSSVNAREGLAYSYNSHEKDEPCHCDMGGGKLKFRAGMRSMGCSTIKRVLLPSQFTTSPAKTKIQVIIPSTCGCQSHPGQFRAYVHLFIDFVRILNSFILFMAFIGYEGQAQGPVRNTYRSRHTENISFHAFLKLSTKKK